ncbi:NUMOD3 domain-containing DNA-binding protein [Fimbriiglobus ruber]|uniref:NUMOD3 domain-containing DNA-binding protein n=1 Tax=Fimbriiglobus ruber TaxID=1908690 RepID=UPI00117AF273|nr:NUMOD3 domain-containing DNA-binding protein [Fimbriiglobus ruber]
MACVYWIHLAEHTNIITQGYIGFSSTTAKERWQHHKYDSKKSRKRSYPLYRALRKHGEKIIVSTLLVGSSEYCLEIEAQLRDKPNTGWNLAVGGGATMLGCTHSADTRNKISRRITGRKLSESHKAKMRAIGRTPEWLASLAKARQRSPSVPSAETRRKMAASQRGRKLAAETKEKIRQKALGHKRNVGRPVSERARELIRQKATGRRHTEATKLKLSRDRIGISVSPETLQKMRQAKRAPLTCPHCQKTGKAGGMKRHHMDHCKFKDQAQCPVSQKLSTDSWKPPPTLPAATEVSPRK